MSILEIPKAILYGIPLAMGWQLTKNYWHKDEGQPDSQCKIGANDTNINKSRELEISQYMEQNGIEKKCSARQSIMLLKNEHIDNTPNTMPFKCTKKPPDEINLFSDGSWLCPTKRFLILQYEDRLILE